MPAGTAEAKRQNEQRGPAPPCFIISDLGNQTLCASLADSSQSAQPERSDIYIYIVEENCQSDSSQSDSSIYIVDQSCVFAKIALSPIRPNGQRQLKRVLCPPLQRREGRELLSANESYEKNGNRAVNIHGRRQGSCEG
jgi:hypothetical protein